jgi:hypothetical protein
MAASREAGDVVFELVNTENNPVYQALEISNGNRKFRAFCPNSKT